ncbi:MAG: sigma-70 family RNA polymerase sigma factor [Solirubrobacterales bacterium]
MSPPGIDDALVREASGGDERALGKIFRKFHQPLYRYCLAILGNRQDAEDALQETMLKVLRSLPGEERTIALKPWLYRIAHNESIDLLRRRRPSASTEEIEAGVTEGLAEQVETRQRLRQLIVDLEALPERQRGALLMREAGGLDFEEIGAALGTSAAVARQTLYEARLGLRQMDAGREMDCVTVSKALSDGDRRVRRRRDIRAHLRDCADCRRFAEEIDSRRGDLAAIAPLPAVAAAALLQGLLGGGAGAGAAAAGGTGAAGGALGGTVVKSVGTATLLKGTAAVAVVAAIGVGAADRGGLIHIGGNDPAPASRSGSGSGGAPSSPEATPAPTPSNPDSAGGSSDPAGSQSSIGTRRDTGKSGAPPPVAEQAPANESESAPSPAPANEGGRNVGSESPGKSGVEHPHGRGHAKQTPAAAAHGQETAAGHKSGNGAGKPADAEATGSPEPAHPSHPAESAGQAPPAEPAEPTVPPPAAGAPTKPEGKGPK